MSQVVSQQKIEQATLSNLVGSHACSVQGFQQMFSDVLVQVLFLMNSGVSVVEHCSVIV